MSFEVELKFPLDDPRRIRRELDQLGAQEQPPLAQRDVYFAHPVRDFSQTDEALRIRTVGENCYLTYKGPIVDALSKTRREIELPFGQSAADGDRLAELLELIGFRKVRAVEKRRTPFRLALHQLEIELALDEVDGLGMFLEIEAQADEAGRVQVRDELLRLADSLDLHDQQRRSYLEMLLEHD